jgi:uncharacterized protein (DUF1810 family)
VDDPYHLHRFVSAQDAVDTFDAAVTELRRGRKVSHWMWFVFPQIAGLGHSAMSVRYAISSIHEAQAYAGHEVLGPRLRMCSRIVADSEASSAEHIFGGIDAQKLRSSMTLFGRATPAEPVFGQVLDRFFAGLPDPETERRL